jgi:DNA/RNA endonuclease G (NUC1)
VKAAACWRASRTLCGGALPSVAQPEAEEVIGKNRKITVPAQLWKVILVLPSDSAEPRKNSRFISIIMPNDQTVGFDWTKYRTSARKVEKLTGLRFFNNVDQETAEALRDHLDEVAVKAPQPRRKNREE